MSRLTDLITKAKAEDPQLGADLDREFRALSSRLSFGLNFERQTPFGRTPRINSTQFSLTQNERQLPMLDTPSNFMNRESRLRCQTD